MSIEFQLWCASDEEGGPTVKQFGGTADLTNDGGLVDRPAAAEWLLAHQWCDLHLRREGIAHGQCACTDDA